MKVLNRVALAGALTAIVACATASTAAASVVGSQGGVSAATMLAPGAPGSESYFDLARKGCVGTARNTTSKVWFTVADGVLSDTYWPTIDATNVHTMQYLVTDGHSFTDLQTRDMTYTIVPDPSGMSCTVIASSSAHGYQITTTYIADPARDAVLMHVSFQGPSGDQLYVRLDPLAGGTGGGGAQNAGGNTAEIESLGGQTIPVAVNINTTTNAVNRTYGVPTYEALESSGGFGSESVGYADSPSDGLTMLDSSYALTPYAIAPNGHVTLTAQIPASARGVNLALGFGTSAGQAASVAAASVGQQFASVLATYEQQWSDYDAGPARAVPLARPGGRQRVLRVRQRRPRERRQDLPRCDRRRARLAVGPVGSRRQLHQWGADVLRFLPGGLLTGPVRGVHGAPARGRPQHRAGGDPLPVRPPAAAERRDAAQLAAQRAGRARHGRPAA